MVVPPTDTVSCVAISADNQTLAGGSWKIVRLWRFGTGELFRSLDAHSHWVLSVAISPDGNTLASGSADKTIKLWNLKTGQVLHTLTSYSSWVNVVAISPDGQTFISGSADRTIKLWELNTGKLLCTLKGHSGSVSSLAISPDGQTLASGSTDKTIKLWDLSKRKLLRTLEEHLDWVQTVSISPDSKTLVSGSLDGSIKIWQAVSQSENKPVVSQSANNNLIQITIILISIVLAKFTAGTSLAIPLFIFFSQWMLSNKKKSVSQFPCEALRCIKTLTEHSSSINSLAINPDSLDFVSGSDDQTIKLWNPNRTYSITGHSGFISSVAISPDGKTLVTASSDWVMLWNLQTRELLYPLKGYSRPRLSRIVISPLQVRLEFGQRQTFSVRGLDQNGEEISCGQTTWQASGGNIDTDGRFFVGQREGNFTITVTVGLFKSSASVTVIEPSKLTRLVITPQQVRLEFGQRQTFNVRGLDQRGDEINIGQVSWYSTSDEISTNGTFQAGQNSGSVEIIAVLGEISGYASIILIEPPRVASLVISPSQLKLEFGQSHYFNVRRVLST